MKTTARKMQRTNPKAYARIMALGRAWERNGPTPGLSGKPASQLTEDELERETDAIVKHRTKNSNPTGRIRRPRARLVGVESNPGPRGFRRGAPSAITKAVASLAARRTLLPPSARRKPFSAQIPSGRVVSTRPAPVATSYRRNGVHHDPVVIRGSTIGCYLDTFTGQCYLQNTSGNVTSVNHFTVDPVGGTVDAYDFALFPLGCRRISVNFLMYRFRKLKARYIPVDPTTSGRTVVIASAPEIQSAEATGVLQYAQVANMENSKSCASWDTMSIDLLARGGLRRDWCYIDTDNESDIALERQESPGSLACQVIGTATETRKTIGYLQLEWEIEYKSLSDQDLFNIEKKRAARRLAHATKTPSDHESEWLPHHEDSTPSPPSSLTDSTLLARALEKLSHK